MTTHEKACKKLYDTKLPFGERGSAEREAYRTDQNALTEQFKQDLFEEFGVTGNPKAEKCYSIAYEQGHAYGLAEIYCHFQDIVELIK